MDIRDRQGIENALTCLLLTAGVVVEDLRASEVPAGFFSERSVSVVLTIRDPSGASLATSGGKLKSRLEKAASQLVAANDAEEGSPSGNGPPKE